MTRPKYLFCGRHRDHDGDDIYVWAAYDTAGDIQERVACAVDWFWSSARTDDGPRSADGGYA